MDYNFLDYYNKELTFMREMAHEFSVKHPKVAGRLGMRGIEIADPFVERLIESFCFLSARTHLKLDAEFPLFTQRLLDIIYPNYTAPTPSMGVVQLNPNLKEGDLTKGFCVPRQSAFFTQIAPGESTRCEFRSGQDVQLWPFEITEARLTSIPPDIPSLENHRIMPQRLKGALRIKLKLPGELKFSQLDSFDKLPIYITGDERIVSNIFELLHGHNVASIIRVAHGDKNHDTVVPREALCCEGLSPEQSLLPLGWNIFHGHNLIHEYFSCRQRFYFFTLKNLADGISKNDTNEAEIIVLLDKLSQELQGVVSAENFLLYCTPVINLFPRRIDRLEIDRSKNEFHIVPDRSRPLDFEVYSISKVYGQKAETSKDVIFNPLYQMQHSERGNPSRYFSSTRKKRHSGNDYRKYDTQTLYRGTEVFISLVDQNDAPFNDDIRYLTLEVLVTNRDLPRLVFASGNFTLTMADSAPVHNARFVFQPSAPGSPLALNNSAWRLIRQLSLNYLPLYNIDHTSGGEALRNVLRLFASNVDHASLNQIEALVGCKNEPVTRRLPGTGLLVYGRGVRCILTVDEEGFSGVSPWLFGAIMENYLARHTSINSFTETELTSLQRGEIGLWNARPGRRGVL